MKKDLSHQGNLPAISKSLMVAGILLVGFVFLMMQLSSL